MTRRSRLSSGRSAAIALLLVASAWPAIAPSSALALQAAEQQTGPSLPERLADAEFWALVSEASEPDGYFQITDNYTSNEQEVGRLFTALRNRGVRGDVYLGVGPEQNFTYIAAIRPAIAFIVDIRRQAVMQHLMYKAVFELTKDRADFISLLFSMPRPGGIDETTSIQQIWAAYDPVATDRAVVATNAGRILEHLTSTHGFTFTDSESEQLQNVLAAFARFGPDISTRGAPGRRVGNGQTFSDLTSWSLDELGQPQSFLTTEDHFRYVKMLQERNLIVPLSGDFAGSKALRAVASYVRAHRGRVSAFYVSNVEQYLFADGKQRAFYDNVATLPIDDRSVFIRPFSLRRRTSMTEPLCPISDFLAAVAAGRVNSNDNALACGR
jgi:hypothetical protein